MTIDNSSEREAVPPAGHPMVTAISRLLCANGALYELGPENCSGSFLRIDASLCDSTAADTQSPLGEKKNFLLGHISLSDFHPILNSPREPHDSGTTVATSHLPPTPETSKSPSTRCSEERDSSGSTKRRKVVGGLRLQKPGVLLEDQATNDTDSDAAEHQAGNEKFRGRQVRNGTRFPQRKPRQEPVIPTLEPTSGEKLISGIWRQIYSGVYLTRPSTGYDYKIRIHGTVGREAFREMNTMCLEYMNHSQSSRILEMIVQAYWVECYEARILALKAENPSKSAREVRMEALKEACATLKWKEKDLRNKLSIWRGYNEIRMAGGWVSLVFASSGTYRFCKYRTGFDDNFLTRLRQLRPSFEVAADTLHPEWHRLLEAIGHQSQPLYRGNPHSWVTLSGEIALPLNSTYSEDFAFQFIDESIINSEIFGSSDPRRDPRVDSFICQDCGEPQADDVQQNRCMCFPALYGTPRNHAPVQIFRTSTGKNNGVVARSPIERGAAIGEFVGLITNHISGVDVMSAGSPGRPYQIYQGRIGNFTRFINHSCRPNSQFQTFFWRGIERIIIVSRGVPAGNEITVDYSNDYWASLDKHCLCGESCCRYSQGVPRSAIDKRPC